MEFIIFKIFTTAGLFGLLGSAFMIYEVDHKVKKIIRVSVFNLTLICVSIMFISSLFMIWVL